MKNLTLRSAALSSISLVAALSLAACSNGTVSGSPQIDPKLLPIVFNEGTYAIDVNDPKATTGDADYVFVAQVDSSDGTTYKDPVTIETEDGSQEISDPYTNFHVTVIENLKGELETSVSLPVQKAGGVAQDGSMVVLYEGDLLPEVGSTYMFLAYAQPDGSLLISGPNSSPEVEEVPDEAEASEIAADLADAVVVEKYEIAVKNQIETERERLLSEFDVSEQ